MENSNLITEKQGSLELTRRAFLVHSAYTGLATGMALYGGRVWARENVVERPLYAGIWSETGASEVLGKP